MRRIKEELQATPGPQQAHLICAAVPNRNRPFAEHHWLSRSAILVKAPCPFHVQSDGPAKLPSDLRYLGQGRNCFCYTMQLKLIWADTHREELSEYHDMPKLAARVYWQGNVVVKWANSPERGLSTMCGLVQQQCIMAVQWELFSQSLESDLPLLGVGVSHS